MTKQISFSLPLLLLCVCVLHAQQAGEAPFASLDKAVQAERGGFAGDKSRLSKVFDAERKRLGGRFENELVKWLGTDPEKHYWISSFLKAESYLHGSKPLPHLSLLVKQQGIALVQGKDDEDSRGYVVQLGITAAILSDELGFHTLASAYKDQAERLLQSDPKLSAFVPAVSTADRVRYDEIKSAFRPKLLTTITAETNPQPKARVEGGILNGKALDLIAPAYPQAARDAGASGTVEVRVVFDETGKVIWAKAMTGHPDLRQAAEDAAWRTKFRPTILSGQAVTTSGVLVYRFVR